jgi:AcrR family transcriptional regulator
MSSPGLRERKKQKTRWSIQEHALRLFREQGYEQTTVDQIAAAAEVSPSTFFRYFKTKEDVVIEDEYDPLLLHLLGEAPAELSPIAALRQALAKGFEAIGPEQMEQVYQRTELMMKVPALRMRAMDNFTGSVDMLAKGIGARVGRDPGEVEVRAFAGAVIGALTSAIYIWAGSGGKGGPGELIDRGLALLENGLKL